MSGTVDEGNTLSLVCCEKFLYETRNMRFSLFLDLFREASMSIFIVQRFLHYFPVLGRVECSRFRVFGDIEDGSPIINHHLSHIARISHRFFYLFEISFFIRIEVLWTHSFGKYMLCLRPLEFSKYFPLVLYQRLFLIGSHEVFGSENFMELFDRGDSSHVRTPRKGLDFASRKLETIMFQLVRDRESLGFADAVSFILHTLTLPYSRKERK